MACPILPPVWPMSKSAIYMLVTINVLTAVTSVLINFCFIGGILRKGQHKTPTKIFLVSLSVSGFFVGLISQPVMCANLLLNRSTIHSCTVTNSSFVALAIFCGASLNCLPALSFDRYIRVKKLQYYTKYVTRKRVVIVITMLWINAVVVAFLPMYGAPNFIFYYVVIVCHSINAVVMLFAYVLMITRLAMARVKVRPINTQIGSTSTSMNSVTVAAAMATAATTATAATATTISLEDVLSRFERRRAKAISRQLRITSTIAILVAVVIVSWMPYFVTGLMWSLNVPSSDKDSVLVTMFYVSVTIGFVSSSINPFLYCWRIRNVRKAALAIFRKRFMFKVC